MNYKTNPTAVLIKSEWAGLMDDVELCRDGWDEEIVEKVVIEGFWSVVNGFDGDIEYKKWNIREKWVIAIEKVLNGIYPSDTLYYDIQGLMGDNNWEWNLKHPKPPLFKPVLQELRFRPRPIIR